jgi:hypothetical protein
LIGEDDLSLYSVTDDMDEAIDEIQRFYRVYHSSRTIRGRVVIRTNHQVSVSALTELSNEFSDILDGTPIRAREPYEEERDEPDLLALPRLVLNFDLRSYGRLRRLIDRLNELG